MKSKLKTDQLKNVQDMSYQLLYSQAEWARENGDWKASADLFVLVKDYKKAIEIYGTKGMLEPLYEICKSLDKTKNADAIEKCAKYFKQHKHHSYAKEAYLRLGDLKGLMNLHLELQKWNEAFLLAKQNPDLAVDIYVPYAEYLLSQDKYNEAQKAYIKANKPDLALKIIITLKENAIIQKKYKDASYYYWEMVLSCLKVVSDAKKPSQKDREYLLKSEEYKRMSHIYFAYDLVYLYATQPFEKFTLGDAYLPAVFNAACFLANIIGKDVPKNISLFNIYYAIASIGCSQENFKTARIAYDRLQGMKMPLRLQAKVETECLKIKAKPFSDSSNNICNRCLSHNALLSPIGDKCSVCGHPFIRSMISFETLPIVEFEISENITHEQALDLLKIDAAKPKAKKKDGWEETKAENQQTLSLVNSPPQEVDDLFFKHIKENAEYNMDPENYKPVQVNEKILTFMNFEEVFISSFKAYCTTYPYKYYRNMVSDIPLSICDRCCKIFMQVIL
jgi:intraflagellar transport protein 122